MGKCVCVHSRHPLLIFLVSERELATVAKPPDPCTQAPGRPRSAWGWGCRANFGIGAVEPAIRTSLSPHTNPVPRPFTLDLPPKRQQDRVVDTPRDDIRPSPSQAESWQIYFLGAQEFS